MISTRCVARDLHTVAPGPLERTCWRQFAALWGDCKKSRIAPLNAIIIIIIIIIKDMKVKICRICVTVACIDRLGFHPDEYRVGSPEIMLLARQQWAAQEWCPIPGPAKVSTDSPACPCGQEDQTTEHVLQRCPPSFYVAGYKATREDVWLVSTSLTTDQTLGLHAGAEKMTSFISWVVCWLFVGCLTSQQQASVSQGRICSDNFTCCHTWDRSCRSNVLPHPVTVYWHRADQSQCWPYNARRLAG